MNQLELTLTRLVLGLVAFVAQRFALKNEVLFASSRDQVLGPQLANPAWPITRARGNLACAHHSWEGDSSHVWAHG